MQGLDMYVCKWSVGYKYNEMSTTCFICRSLWSMLTTHHEVLICRLELSILKLIKETTCVMLGINNNIVSSLISRVVVLKVQLI